MNRTINSPLIHLFLAVLLLSGCQKTALKPASVSRVVVNQVQYELIPYNREAYEQVPLDPVFYELELNTCFLLRITNLGNTLVEPRVKDSLILQDSNNQQFAPMENPILYLRERLKSQYSEVSYLDLKESEARIQMTLNQSVLTDNVDFYRSQVNELKDRIYTMEQRQLIQDEINRREKSITELLKVHGYKDQILYSGGVNQGLIIFPPVAPAKLSPLKVFFRVSGEKVVSFSFTLKTSSEQ